MSSDLNKFDGVHTDRQMSDISHDTVSPSQHSSGSVAEIKYVIGVDLE